MKNLLTLSTLILLFTGISFTADFGKENTESDQPDKIITSGYNGDWRRRPLITSLMREPVPKINTKDYKEQRLATFKSFTQRVSKPKGTFIQSEKLDVQMPNPKHFFLSSRDHKFVFKLEKVESVQPDNICLACPKPASPMPILRSRACSLSINTEVVDSELVLLTTVEGLEICQEGCLITTPDNRTPLIGHQPKTLYDLVTAPHPDEDAIKAQLQKPQSSKVLKNGFLHFVFARGNISPGLFSLMNEHRNSIESLDLDDE
jgi:hypothetical protein